MFHFCKTISQTTTYWELGLGLLGIRVILTGMIGFHGRSKVLEKLNWKNGVQPLSKINTQSLPCGRVGRCVG